MGFSTRSIQIALVALACSACGDDGTSSTTNADSSGTAGTSPTSSSTSPMTTASTMTTQGEDASASGDSTTMPAEGSSGSTTEEGSGSTAAESTGSSGSSGSTGSSSSTSDGASSSESTTGGPCCDPDKAPICIEGVSCCDDGTWACNEGAGQPTCAGGLGEVCGGCAIQGESCLDTDCCGMLECCSGQPIPPGMAICFAGPCPISDKNRKRDFDPVDAAAVLETVSQLPISTWSYTFEPKDVRHMGPMAQDFAAAFGLGSTDEAIFTVDADGVALAAIQALHGELERVQAQKAALEERVGDLEARLRALETASR